MTTDLDRELGEIAAALVADAPPSPPLPPVSALVAENRRALASPSRRTGARWLAVTCVATAVAAVAVLPQLSTRTDHPIPRAAMVDVPAAYIDRSAANACAQVSARAATVAEASTVSFLPADLPSGFITHEPGRAGTQHRPAVSSECWDADATYVAPTSGAIVSVTVASQDNAPQTACERSTVAPPVRCVTIQGRPAALIDEGTRSIVSWPTADGQLVSVSAYGLSDAELTATANSVRFDGDGVTVQAPPGMVQVEDGALRRSDSRDVVYFAASFAPTSVADMDEPPAGTVIHLSISTWDDLSINDVGPTQLVDVNGTTAVVVITGGPGTGLVRWIGGSGPVSAGVAPPSAYITWRVNGVSFRIDGPDAETIVEVARALQPTG